VRDTSGTPMAGVEIVVRDRTSQKIVAKSSSRLDGHFVFWRVAPGEYDVTFRTANMNSTLCHIRIDEHGSKELLLVKLYFAT
jgi:hypothetical protein